MRESLHFIGAAPQNKHVVFVEDKEEAAAFDPALYFDTPAELLDRSFNRPRQAVLESTGAVLMGRAATKGQAKKVIKRAEE